MPDLAQAQKRLRVKFNDPSLLEQSLTHRSFLHENPDYPLPNNERLEFLGDALLNLAVAERLYVLQPPLSEGEMTQVRSALVRRETLGRLAHRLGLGEYLRLGRGEEKSGGGRRPSILAGAMEAVIGAVLLDRGVGPARKFVDRLLRQEWNRLLRQGLPTDYKSRLQEVVQSRGQPPPRYRVLEAKGLAHKRSFLVEVRMADQALAQGRGRRRKDAETEAARLALEALSSAPPP